LRGVDETPVIPIVAAAQLGCAECGLAGL
jgi:hypothetical protein